MKKSLIIFIFVSLLASLVQAQLINTVITATSTMDNDPTVYLNASDYQKTISFFPDKTVSCHEAVTSNGWTSFITINEDIISGGYSTKRFPISYQILIRDMVQHNFTDTIYFCGTRILPNGDSIGTVGYFVLLPSSSVLYFMYVDIPEVNTLTKLVSLKGIGYNSSAAIGVKVVNGQKNYSIVQTFMSTQGLLSTVYFYSPILHNSTPFDIISTDKYVVLASYDMQNNLYLRKFSKDSLSDNMRNTLYKYQLSENIIFTPHATFFGDLQNKIIENDIGVVFTSVGNNGWTVHLKTFDINLMQMSYAQTHALVEKNEALDIAYMASKKKVGVLEQWDPNYDHYFSSIVLFNPTATSGYTSTKFNSNPLELFYSIDKMYAAKNVLDHFLVGNIHLNQSRVMVHNVAYTATDGCLDANDIRIDTEHPDNTTVLTNPMTNSVHGTALSLLLLNHFNLLNQSCVNGRSQ